MSGVIDTTELRGDVPKWASQVFEAVRAGRKVTKDALLTQIVVEWARREMHVATLIERMTRGNALDTQAEGDGDGR